MSESLEKVYRRVHGGHLSGSYFSHTIKSNFLKKLINKSDNAKWNIYVLLKKNLQSELLGSLTHETVDINTHRVKHVQR